MCTTISIHTFLTKFVEALVRRFWFPGHQISWVRVIEYAIFLHGLAHQWRPLKKRNLAQR